MGVVNLNEWFTLRRGAIEITVQHHIRISMQQSSRSFSALQNAVISAVLADVCVAAAEILRPNGGR
jgi:hypothetical protein